MSNQASATIILDSISPDGIRLTTFQLRYWRGIHSELMTHRAFSRNAGSSRARPSKAIIEQVRTNPWGPIHWGANQPGMQAHEELRGITISHAQNAWRRAAEAASGYAEELVHIGAHKQIVNRILEPFTYIDVLVTATDYANWFALRDHPDAQPEIQELARLMREAYTNSTPQLLQHGEWHLPYTLEEDWDAAGEVVFNMEHKEWTSVHEAKLEIVRKISVARCARVSYKAFDGTHSTIEKDLERYDKLVSSQPLHASPAEHQATPDRLMEYNPPYNPAEWESAHLHGNFRGWCQYRKMLPNEYVPD